MALNITPSTEPLTVDRIVGLVYGAPGAGKTSAAFSAARPILLDFDNGAHRSAYRKDTVQVSSWSEVTMIHESDLTEYDTIVVDTAGRAVEALMAHIVSGNAKMGNGAGGMSQRGWGALKADFATWLKQMRSFGKDVILIAHDKDTRDGDDVIVRPDITGGSYAEIFKLADFVAHLGAPGGQRVLSFRPSDKYVGKDPAKIGSVDVPNLTQEPEFMAGLIAQVKAKIGQLSEDAKAVIQEVNSWRVRIDEAERADDLTAVFTELKASDLVRATRVQVWGLMKAAGDARGYTFDKDTGFTAAEAA